MKTIFILLAFLITLPAYSQLEKTIHQTFEIGDFEAITLDLVSDSTQIVPWAGNTVMTETKIELYGASPSILKHFVEKENRYAIETDTLGVAFKLFSTQKERKPIRTRSGECPEIVQIRVFVPENFEQTDRNTVTKLQ